MQAIIDVKVEKMQCEGVIEPLLEPVEFANHSGEKTRGSAPILHRHVNEVTTLDAYPLPQIIATLDKLRGAKYLTTLDLKSEY